MTAAPTSNNFDQAELDKFAALANRWWDADGPQKPLHALNPVRLQYVAERAALRGARVLDIGCGGGLICEPLARLGGRVTGIDAADRNVATARLHAAGQNLAIDYRATTAEAMVESGARFDIVLALEIVEHVADVDLFLQSVGELAKPGGLVFLSTLNRTAKAWALAVAGAEYVLRWLPRGTHDWRKFVKPSEAVRGLRRGGVETREIAGVVYSPLSRAWSLNKRDLDVNYMLYGSKGVG